MCNREHEHELNMQIEELESDIEYIKKQMKEFMSTIVKHGSCVCDSTFYDGQFTAACIACKIVGVSLEEQEEIVIAGGLNNLVNINGK